MKSERTITSIIKFGFGCFVIAFPLAQYLAAQSTGKAESGGVSAATALITLNAIHERWHKVSLSEEQAAAAQGDPTAQCHLAWRFEKGEGLEKDTVAAVGWMRKSANQGLAAAQCALGWMYEKGVGIQPDRGVAMEWSAKAAKQGFMPAEVNLGWMYANEPAKPGETTRGNYPVAAEWYEKAATKGHANAQFLLAELYRYRKLGDSERTNCVSWYFRAAEQGHSKAEAAIGEIANEFRGHELLTADKVARFLQQSAEKGNLDAQWELARRYRTGDGIPKDSVKAFAWMTRAAESRSESTRVADAWYALGVMHETGEGTVKNPSAAWPLFLSAANSNLEATYRVGRMFEEGTGVTPDDTMAAEYYTRAATAGWGDHVGEARERLVHLYASGRGLSRDKNKAEEQLRLLENVDSARVQMQLGEMFYEGRFVNRNVEAAVERYTRAARLGSSEAKNRIGELWASGASGEPDFKEAVECYRLAAKAGLPAAQFNLGQCYAKGQGVTQDRVEAWRWLQSATKRKHISASNELAKVQSEMTADELARAKAMESPARSAR